MLGQVCPQDLPTLYNSAHASVVHNNSNSLAAPEYKHLQET